MKNALIAIGCTILAVSVIFAGPVLAQPTPEKMADDVVAGINTERQRLGLAPLAVNESLMLMARWRSEDMATGGYFSHQPPDGHPTLDDLLARLGYDWQYRPAENISAVRPLLARSAAPYLAIDSWRDSPGHWRWAMSPEQTMTGVGVAISRDGTVIVTQLFWDPYSAPPSER